MPLSALCLLRSQLADAISLSLSLSSSPSPPYFPIRYEPLQKFMLVKTFDSQLPSPLNVFEPFVVKTEEYPIICVGVTQGEGENVKFDTINLNSNATWFPNNDTQVRLTR